MSGAGRSVVGRSVVMGISASGRCSGPQGAELRRVYRPRRDVDRLLFGVKVQGAVAALVAEPGRLDPAERRAQVAYVVRVEPDHPGLDAMRERVGARQVGGPEVGGQAVLY